MTGYPEVALAAELGVRYASIGLISNPAAGLSDTEISLDEIWHAIRASKDVVLDLFARVVAETTPTTAESSPA